MATTLMANITENIMYGEESIELAHRGPSIVPKPTNTRRKPCATPAENKI